MSANFCEILIVEPAPGKSFSDPQVISDLQSILNTFSTGLEAINFQIRKSTISPTQLLFLGSWTSLIGHDDLDLRGITPRMLKLLFANVVVISAYFFFIDANKIDLQAEVCNVEAFHVKTEEKERFESEVEKRELSGGWYVTKKLPPRPRVMPTDPELVKIIEAGEERAKARLAAPNPNLWVSISSVQTGTGDFRSIVENYVSKVDSGAWEKYLTGSSFIPLT
ncbi:hypothetical protein EG329_006435 [Mollisiaceae sp. DMI_Dod_QoI]|nr:hypothetical protein EG329_006435 [Helotiales sp. DMI_Dod_QoI]